MREHDTTDRMIDPATERAALQLEVLRRATEDLDRKRAARAADPGDVSRRSRLSPLRRTAQIFAPDADRLRRMSKATRSGQTHTPETLFFA